VFPHLSVAENLRVVHERTKGADRGALDDALDLFPALRGLLGRPAGLLSGGQAQQLAIARTLVTRPALLVLDEPTEGIQPSIILEIEDAIAALHRAGGLTILLVEQYVEFALRLADRYAVMESGQIVHAGATSDADMNTFAELLAV
jgi:urea transport system ATP-binding protein